MRLHILIAGVTLAVGIALGVVLIPSNREVALMRLRDKDFSQARTAYEAQYSQGDHSSATAMALTRLYLQTGEVNQAITLVEEVVAKDPDNMEARKILGTLYQYAQRPGDYLRNLEAIARLQPTQEHLTELSNIYNYMAEYGKQIEVLRRLVAAFPDQSKPAVDLAYLLASRGDAREAVDLLLDLEQRRPGKGLDLSARRTLVSLLLDLGRSDDVLAIGRGWLGPNPTNRDLVDMASLFTRRRRPDLGVMLLNPFRAKLEVIPEFVILLADLEISAGRQDDARKTLRDWVSRGPLANEMLAEFVDRALALTMEAEALEVARHADPVVFSNAQLTQLVEVAYRLEDSVFINALLERTGDQFLSSRPTLGLELAIARKDAAAVERWVVQAVDARTLTFGDRLGLVSQLLRLNRKDIASRVLDSLDLSIDLSEEQLDVLAASYIDLARNDDGYRFFSSRRREHPTDAAERGWMRLALHAGHLDEVESWLATQQRPTTAQLVEVYGAAADAKVGSLALAAAEPLYRRESNIQYRFWYANALLLSERPDEALPILRSLNAAPGSLVGVEPIYLAALEASGRIDELSLYLTDRLNRGDLTDQEQADLIYVLVDRKAYKGALPLLRERASRADDWYYAYVDVAIKAESAAELIPFLIADLERVDLKPAQVEARVAQLSELSPPDAVAPVLRLAEKDPERWLPEGMSLLTKLGKTDELHRILAQYAADPRLSDERRMDVVYAALDRLDKTTAVLALLPIAERGSPTGQQMQQLLFLWGPRPGKVALDWLEARATAAKDDSKRAEWLGLVSRLGAPARTLELLAGRTGGPLLDAALEAHALLGHQAEVKVLARQSLANEATPVEHWRRYARMMEGFRDNGTASALWRAVLTREPGHKEALRQVGMLAYDENRLKDAENLLRRYLETHPDDYEAYYFMGEVLTAVDRKAEANRFYRVAMAQLLTKPSLSDAEKINHANLLYRQGKAEQAIAIVRGLHRQRPKDAVLRADLVGLYIDRNQLKPAARLLALD